jgi:hypothetical protein
MSIHETTASFIAQGKAIAVTLPPNTVQVWPGGATFTSIQAAINSITNAGPQLQYQVAVGAGTYNEAVTMKDFVFIIGSGSTVTTITAPGASNPNGVITSAANGGVSEITLISQSGGWGTWTAGVLYSGSSAGKFHISGVHIISGDKNAVGNNVRGISNNTGSYAGNLIISQTIIEATGGDSSTAEGMELFGMGGLTVLANLVTINVQSQAQSFGITTAVNAIVNIEESKIIAQTWALYNSDGTATITATDCVIDGPVSSGVIVK